MSLRCIVATLILLALVSPAAHATRNLGDNAGELQVGQWLKGGPVSIAAGKGTNVYIVEFWASWCGDCRTSVPILTSLQHHYGPRGLIVVGIDIWENNTTDGPNYVQAQGDAMDYAVATDSASHYCQSAYMTHFDDTYGVPYAYVVDKSGHVVYADMPHNASRTDVKPDLAQMLDTLMPLTISGPNGGFVEVGQPHTFSVTQQGLLEPVGYQWRKNGVAIPGATESTYTIEACMPEDGGKYDCILTSAVPGDPVVTDAATLGVYPVGSLPVAGLPGLMALAALVGVFGSAIARRRPAKATVSVTRP